ncbi:MAG TPA: DUF2284 domain-containing protein [Syntrophorhabdaceae bacterium]|nr:DUF2284 domain-containing protein [Syntrophorhabdaceae bacterium]
MQRPTITNSTKEIQKIRPYESISDVSANSISIQAKSTWTIFNYCDKLLTMEIIQPAEAAAFDVAGICNIDPALVRFSLQFRDYCAQDKCGYYGKNWMCPPAVGEFEVLMARIGQYRECIVFQTIHPVQDSRDKGVIREAFRKHNEALKNIKLYICERHGVKDLLALGGGPCRQCETCSATTNQSCRNPEEAVASLESYGIDVGALMATCNMPYSFAQKTITLVGAVFYNEH